MKILTKKCVFLPLLVQRNLRKENPDQICRPALAQGPVNDGETTASSSDSARFAMPMSRAWCSAARSSHEARTEPTSTRFGEPHQFYVAGPEKAVTPESVGTSTLPLSGVGEAKFGTLRPTWMLASTAPFAGLSSWRIPLG